MERDFEWENRVGFNPDIDYIAIVEQYNSLVGSRDSEGIEKLLRDQGGLIRLVGNAQYQKGLLTGRVIVRKWPKKLVQ